MSKKKSGKINWQAQAILIFLMIAGIVFLPSTFMIFIGLLPTFVVIAVDRSENKTKVFTVGAMNLAGCSPFLMELWLTQHTFEQAMLIIQDPKAIIVMYSAAGVGYVINWAMSGIAAAVLYQRAQERKKAIKKRQRELIDQWGQEVTGDVPLDEHGFPIYKDGAPPSAPKKAGE